LATEARVKKQENDYIRINTITFYNHMPTNIISTKSIHMCNNTSTVAYSCCLMYVQESLMTVSMPG